MEQVRKPRDASSGQALQARARRQKRRQRASKENNGRQVSDKLGKLGGSHKFRQSAKAKCRQRVVEK